MPSPTTERLYRELHESLHGFVSRRVPSTDDADDIVQDVFTRIHANSDKLAEAESVSGWIYRVTRNAITDHHRARAAAARATERYAQEPLRDASEDPVLAATEMLSCSVKHFIDELPDDFREALELTDLGGMTQKEAAEQLGLSVSGMKSRVQRGRAKLGDLLRDCCEIELDARRGVMGFERRVKKDDDCSC